MEFHYHFRTKGVTIDIPQIYRDCNAASHYLGDSLTTTKCKGPLKGKMLVSSIAVNSVVEGEREKIARTFRSLGGCIVVALQDEGTRNSAILLQCNPLGGS